MTCNETFNRFKKFVLVQDGCWIWQGATLDGYGRFRLSDKMMLAHRASYELFVGPIPEGLKILHKCDTPACVKPDHLFIGTQATNMADMAAKGRSNAPKGEAHNNTKLSDLEVLDIRRIYAAGGTTQAKLARMFNICPAQISNIVNGKSRKG